MLPCCSRDKCSSSIGKAQHGVFEQPHGGGGVVRVSDTPGAGAVGRAGCCQLLHLSAREDFAFSNLDNTSWWSKQASHLALGRARGGDKGEELELQLH